jgi:hypothetical protein
MAKHPEPVVRNTAAYFQASAPGRLQLEVYAPAPDPETLIRTGVVPEPSANEAVWLVGPALTPRILPEATLGFREHGRMGIARTVSLLPVRQRDDDQIITTLVHEMQHEMSHLSDMSNDTVPGDAHDEAWLQFRGEHNAYWADGSFGNKSDAKPETKELDAAINGGKPLLHKSARSYAILKFLLARGEYPQICAAYRSSDRFREAVHQYDGVRSANPHNDPKVDDFVRAATSSLQSEARTQWEALDAAQKAAIRQNTELAALIIAQQESAQPYRTALLGFVHGDFEAADFSSTLGFLWAIQDGQEVAVQRAGRALSSAAKHFIVAEPVGQRVFFEFARAQKLTATWALPQLEAVLK